MKNQQKLVLQHLEDISWKVLDEYPQIIRNMIKGKWGVYALLRQKLTPGTSVDTRTISRNV